MNKEEMLIAKVKTGHLHAYEELIKPYLLKVRVQIAYYYPNPELVDELTHQVFIFAFQNISKFKKGNFGAWLKAISNNLVLKERKRLQQKSRNQFNFQEFLIMNYNDSDSDEQVGHLQECLQKLKEEHYDIIQWRYRDKQSCEQISVHLERKVSWVKTTLHRIRKILRVCVSNKGVNFE
jgi:RNA polymerase sigma-70 factor, ECF subfamily